MEYNSATEIDHVGPTTAATVAETGLHVGNLLNLILKTLLVRGVETPKQLAHYTRLHVAVLREALETAKQSALVEILGSIEEQGYSDFRYSLTQQGHRRATEAMALCQYIGPAPVPLDDYRNQVRRQAIRNEQIAKDKLHDHLSHLVLNAGLKRTLGPAINSGKTILLYGPAGNGKTSIANAVAEAFGDEISIPFAIEVEGEIIKLFDPLVHRPVENAERISGDLEEAETVRQEFTDRRWIRCRRPTVMMGGELTMQMLELYFSPVSKFYEAPMQIKANGGVLILDDLGRQNVAIKDLFNRWIIPMEKHIDYMVLQSGATFSIPFDNFLIFSTNLEPADLMDAAFLRRIAYKAIVDNPSEHEFRTLFAQVCKKHSLTADEACLNELIDAIRTNAGLPLAYYQAEFIVEQVIASAKYEGQIPAFTRDRVIAAVENLMPRKPVSDPIGLSRGGAGP